MYEQFFGLREMPFTVMPDPRFAYRSLGHKLAEGKMRFAADQRMGLAVLTGPIGAGKTTTANLLVQDWSEDEHKAVSYLPSADDRGRSAFLKRVMNGFGIASTARNYGDNRDVLEAYLLRLHQEGKHAILVIDEGQRIHAENLDTLTDLTNFQTASDKFLTIILFAQDNFAAKLVRKEAFQSRIAMSGHLDPLSFEDMLAMIGHRLTVGGAQVPMLPENEHGDTLPDLASYLTRKALVSLYKVTKGVPRDVCILLNAAMVNAYLTDVRPLTDEVIAATVAEMAKLKKWPIRVNTEHLPREPRRKSGDTETESESEE